MIFTCFLWQEIGFSEYKELPQGGSWILICNVTVKQGPTWQSWAFRWMLMAFITFNSYPEIFHSNQTQILAYCRLEFIKIVQMSLSNAPYLGH